MPRGKPLEGAPGWRVIERPQQRPWRAGYVIVPLAACAGLFLALTLLEPDWPAWLEGRVVGASDSSLLKAREVELLEAAKSQVLETLAARKADRAQDIADARRADARRIGAQPMRQVSAGSPEKATRPAAAQASATPPIRVFIHHEMGAADAARAARLGAFLRDRGFIVAGVRSVAFQIDVPSVRYFFDRDRAESLRLIEALEASAVQAPDRLTAFTHFSPKPRQGNVEVWLAGRPASWTRSAQADPPS